MILVDTSIWIDHLRRADTALIELLEGVRVFAHPFVIGEMALGSLRDRASVLEALKNLPRPVCATDSEVLAFIDADELAGAGIGYIDAHLLASARLSPALLWTRDKRLRTVAARLGLHADLP